VVVAADAVILKVSLGSELMVALLGRYNDVLISMSLLSMALVDVDTEVVGNSGFETDTKIVLGLVPVIDSDVAHHDVEESTSSVYVADIGSSVLG
jgi:hypothetical protein